MPARPHQIVFLALSAQIGDELRSFFPVSGCRVSTVVLDHLGGGWGRRLFGGNRDTYRAADDFRLRNPPGRGELLEYVRAGDVVVVWKLDRLGRSLRDLIEIVAALNERGIGLRSLHESIDTTTPAGKLTFHVFAALAEFERDVVRERTRAGLAAARDRGAQPGRPRALSPEQVEMARTLLTNPNLSARQVAGQLGVHRATLYRSLASHDRR